MIDLDKLMKPLLDKDKSRIERENKILKDSENDPIDSMLRNIRDNNKPKSIPHGMNGGLYVMAYNASTQNLKALAAAQLLSHRLKQRWHSEFKEEKFFSDNIHLSASNLIKNCLTSIERI